MLCKFTVHLRKNTVRPLLFRSYVLRKKKKIYIYIYIYIIHIYIYIRVKLAGYSTIHLRAAARAKF